MKSSDMAISETILESLIYSVSKSGHYAQAEAFVQVLRVHIRPCFAVFSSSVVKKFVASANEAALRTAIARAAVSRGDMPAVISTLASIPSSAKLNQVAVFSWIS